MKSWKKADKAELSSLAAQTKLMPLRYSSKLSAILLVTKEASMGWGMGCRQRGNLILAMAIETEAFRLFSVAHLLKWAMRLVKRQGGGTLLGSQPQEK